MSGFFANVLQALPRMRTKLQFGIVVLTILAFVFVQTRADSPVLPQIFIFAVVPLLISMQLVSRLRDEFQYRIILIITLMCLAFLATGVTLSLHDKSSRFHASYDQSVFDPLQKLNARYLIDQKQRVERVETYSDYRNIVLDVMKDDRSHELAHDFDRIVSFYESYVECRNKWQCLGSRQLDGYVVDFWYSYRPIVEERRVSYWGKEFAKGVQTYAEAIRPPLFLSAIKKNPLTQETELVSAKPQRKV